MIKFILFNLFTFFLYEVHASESILLWGINDKKNNLTKTKMHDKKLHRHVTYNRQITSKVVIGSILDIDIDKEKNIFATVNRITHHTNGSLTIFASYDQHQKNFPIVITTSSRSLFATIITSHGNYIIRGTDDNIQIFNENDIDALSGVSVQDYKVFNDTKLIPDHSEETTSVKSSIDDFASEYDTTIANIDVLFVYSKSASLLYENDIETRINHLVSVTNNIYNDSKVHINIEVAGTIEIDYDESRNFSETLDDITDGVAPFDDVLNIRYEKGADLLTFLRPINGSASGIAWLTKNSAGLSGDYARMLSVVGVNGKDNILAHELGHNLGLAHSRRQDGNGGVFPFGLGFGVDSEFTTIMAYPDFFGTVESQSIYKFSSADSLCGNYSCGVDKENTTDGADSVYALNAVRFQAQNLISSTPDLTLISDVIEDVEDEALKACIEEHAEQKGLKYAKTITTLVCSTWSDDQKDITSIKGIEHFSEITWLDLNYNKISDISLLSQLPKLSDVWLYGLGLTNQDISVFATMKNLSTLRLGDNNITDISALENLTSIDNLGLSHNEISDISVLSNFTKLHSLFLSNNLIVDVSPLSELTLLEKLQLDENQIVDISPLKKLTLLFQLLLMSNQISDISPLSNMTLMTELLLGNNSITDISPLSEMKLLDRLMLQGNNISNIAVLENFKELRTLYSSETLISDLTPLQNLTSLQTLFIANSNVNDVIPLHKLVNLIELDLSSTPVADISPIFSLINISTWSYNRLSENVNMYCWQLTHLGNVLSVDKEFLLGYANCDNSQDYFDYDGDGMANRIELDNERDPTIAQQIVNNINFDQNGDGKADVLWRNRSSGQNWLWTMNGLSISKSSNISSVSNDWDIAGRGDFNGDGKSDVLWRNKTSGRNYLWLMDGFSIKEAKELSTVTDLNWQVKAVNDFNADGKVDIFWHHQTTGRTYIWEMDGFTKVKAAAGYSISDIQWQVVGAGDIDNDGNSDIIWRHQSSGKNYVWLMNGTTVKTRYSFSTIPTSWDIVGLSDLNGDGTDDILWRNKNDGRNWGYLMKDGHIETSRLINTIPDNDWKIAMTGDFNGDGNADIFWRHQGTGKTYIYLMDGVDIINKGYSVTINNNWQVID